MAIDDIVFDVTEAGMFEIPIIGSTYNLSGQVVNGSGTPQSGVLVKAFRTANDQYVDSDTTDGSGNYAIITPYYETHYLVAYLDSSTDLAGTTVNTIMPVP